MEGSEAAVITALVALAIAVLNCATSLANNYMLRRARRGDLTGVVSCQCTQEPAFLRPLKGISNAMPNSVDYALGRDRPGRGSSLKPLVRANRQRSLSAVVADSDPALWLEAISLALDAGYALLLSPTSDGGAFSITLLAGDDRFRSYCATGAEVTGCLDAVRSYCAPSKPDADTPPARRPKRP